MYKLGSKSSCFPLLQELMADLISQRDQGRQELFDTIDLFCKEVDVMPLQEREKSLQVWWLRILKKKRKRNPVVLFMCFVFGKTTIT